MTYGEFLHQLINHGIEAAREDYAGDDPSRQAKLAGSIDGFEDCRDQLPAQIALLLKEAAQRTLEANSRFHCGEISIDDYWRVRCREAEVEWVANCVSVIEIEKGRPPIVIPTARAVLAVAKIVGVSGERTVD